MAKRKADMSLEYQLKLAIEGLTNDFKRWDTIYSEGCFDPNYTDGFNLNFKRRHINIAKSRIEKLCEELGCEYPDIYHRPTPPEMDREYMAKENEIRLNARLSYEKLSENSCFKEMLSHEERLTRKQLESICFYAVKGYVTRLAEAIKEDNLVYMRLYCKCEHYIESITTCAERARKLVSEPIRLTVASAATNAEYVQLSLFDL